MDAPEHSQHNPYKMRAGERTYSRINWTASSYIIPHSIRAMATKTGALEGETSTYKSIAHQLVHGGRQALK